MLWLNSPLSFIICIRPEANSGSVLVVICGVTPKFLATLNGVIGQGRSRRPQLVVASGYVSKVITFGHHQEALIMTRSRPGSLAATTDLPPLRVVGAFLLT